ncbi:MAG: hypothetical protein M3320_10150, partial [Actinomycetota bacterium]|nr:hypothetical protein [Actinomycetota bacterium]
VGTALRARGGGVAIVRGRQVVATISAPRAWDAAGRAVPASMRIDGDELVVRVRHRAAGVRHPVLVDPALEEVFSDFDGYNGWASDVPQTTGESRCKHQLSNSAYNDVRLSRPSPICDELVNGKPRFYADMSYAAPGTTAVTRADFLPTAFSISRDLLKWCARTGIRRADGTEVAGKAGAYDAPQDQALLPSPSTDCTTALGETTSAGRTHYADTRVQNSRAFWTMRDAKATRDSNTDWTARLPGASAWLDDNDRPTLAVDTRENLLDEKGWSFEAPAYTTGWTGYSSAEVSHDSWGLEMHGTRHLAARRFPGSGTGTMWVDSPKVPAIAGRTYAGDFWARHQMSTYAEQFRAELVFYNAAGAEVGKAFGGTALDRPWPRWRRAQEAAGVAPSGSATVALRMVWLDSNDGEWHNAEAARIEEVCAGGCAAQWTNAGKRVVSVALMDPGLGPKRINYTHPGGSETRTHSCAGTRHDRCWVSANADMGFNQVFRYDAATMAEGVHQVGVSGTDFVGNATAGNVNAPTYDFGRVPAVKVDHSQPSLELGGTLAAELDSDGDLVEDSYTLTVRGRDGTSQAPRSGAVQLQMLVNGVSKAEWTVARTCPEGSCALPRDNEPPASFVLDPDLYPDGPVTVKVVATDAVGLTQVKEWQTMVDRHVDYTPSSDVPYDDEPDEMDVPYEAPAMATTRAAAPGAG